MMAKGWSARSTTMSKRKHPSGGRHGGKATLPTDRPTDDKP